METNFEYAEKSNQQLWDELTPVHVKSYNSINTLKKGGVAVSEIERRELGEVNGKTLLHLQCHIGTDSLSWARLGAKVTGIDFSEQSIAYANQLKKELELEATFLQSNVYHLRENLQGEFDIVYTSKGVLCWLRDLDEWGRIVAHFLKPGGTFYLMESHPVCNIFNYDKPGDLEIIYPYFHSAEPIVEDNVSDYEDHTYIRKNASYEWFWSVSDILNALIKAGLTIEMFNEYDKLFYRAFPDIVEDDDGWFYLPKYVKKVPLMFTLKARK